MCGEVDRGEGDVRGDGKCGGPGDDRPLGGQAARQPPCEQGGQGPQGGLSVREQCGGQQGGPQVGEQHPRCESQHVREQAVTAVVGAVVEEAVVGVSRVLQDQVDPDLGGGQDREDVAHPAHPSGEEQKDGEQECGRGEETAGGGGFGGPEVVSAVGEPGGRTGQEGRA